MELTPKVKDAVKALVWFTIGIMVLFACVGLLKGFYFLVFDYEHFDDYVGSWTGKVVHANEKTQQLQELGKQKAEELKKLKQP